MFDISMPNALDTKADRIFKTEDDKYLAATIFYFGRGSNLYVDKKRETMANNADVAKAIRNGSILLIDSTNYSEEYDDGRGLSEAYRPVIMSYWPIDLWDDGYNNIIGEDYTYNVYIAMLKSNGDLEYRRFHDESQSDPE